MTDRSGEPTSQPENGQPDMTIAEGAGPNFIDGTGLAASATDGMRSRLDPFVQAAPETFPEPPVSPFRPAMRIALMIGGAIVTWLAVIGAGWVLWRLFQALS